MPLATEFRDPLGNGTGALSPANDGDGFYVAQYFGDWNSAIGSYHLGVDWNGEGGGNTDLGEPVYAVAAAEVVTVVDDQNGSTSGFGNYVVLRDLPPSRPSFITRVLGVDSGRFRVGQARRARRPQIAQAPGARRTGSCCPARNGA